MGQQGPPGAKKKRLLSKMIVDHMECQNKCFLAHFEFVVARFGPPKIPNCLENGLIWDKKWVKRGSKMWFSKNNPRPFGVPKQVKWARLSPLRAILAPPKSQNALKIGCFGTQNGSKMGQKWVKNGSEMCFSNNDPRPFGVHKQVKYPNILLDYSGCTNNCNEPILSPCGAILAPLKALKMG